MALVTRRTVVRLSRDERMRDIVTAARGVFVERGFEAASTAEIAANAGVSEGTIYKYFDSKRDVLLAVIEAWYQSMIGDFAEQLEGIQGTRNKIHYIVWRHLKSITDDVKMCRLCYYEVRHSDDYYQTPIYEFNRRYTRVLVDVCREGVNKGELRQDLPIRLLRDMIFGGIDATVSRLLFSTSNVPFDAKTIAQEIVDLFFAGVDGVAANVTGAARSPGKLDAVAERLERAVGRLEQVVAKAPKPATRKTPGR